MRRYLQNPTNRIRARQRRATIGSRFTFGQFAATLGIGLVMVLLGVTFLGDYLRIPKLTLTAFPDIISPNGDQTQDLTNLSYSLSEDASVSINVLNQNGLVVRHLGAVKNQPSGQYVAVWDGKDDAGVIVADGAYTAQIAAKGSSKVATQAVGIVVDTKPPPLQLTNLDELTRVATPGLSIEGITEPGATVYQAGNAQAIAVDSQGYFQLERQLSEGDNILEILASDRAGNTTRRSHKITLVTRPPELTLITPTNDQWLNEKVLEVTGVAPAAASVTVNNQPAALQDDGTFKRELILQEGDNTVRVEATDDVGNKTVTEQLIHLKTTPPKLELNIQDNAVFQQSKVQLTGRTDPGSIVRVNNRLVSVSPLGEFQTPIGLMNGNNTLNVEVRDVAGNVASLRRRVTFKSPVAQNEVSRFFSRLPALSSLATPLLILIPVLLLIGYLFTRPMSLLLTSDLESFTPGLPDEGQVVTLTLNLSKSARTTVQVVNQYNRPVTTITHRRQRSAGLHTITWDGYDDWGRIVPPGEYTLQATASTPSGTVSSAVPLIIQEDPLVHTQYGQKYYTPYIEQAGSYAQRSATRGRR